MSIPDTIRAMRQAGVPDDQIVDTVLAMSEERLAKGRARQAKYQSNKKKADVSDVKNVNDVSGVLHYGQKKGPEPQKKNTNSPKENPPYGGQKKRGSRLPEDFEPHPDDVAALKAKRTEATDEVIAEETEKFRDHWKAQPGQRGVKLDWRATWRNWMRNARLQLRASPAVRSNGTGVYIRKGSRQWDAWRQHYRKVNDERTIFSMDHANEGEERKFKAEWPSQATW